MPTNIFEEADEKVMPSWAKFTNPGDSVQGTYVGKIVGQVDGYGNLQTIYQLLQDDDTIVNVGFGLNKKVIHADMEQVGFGQIVGFKYKGTVAILDKRSGKTINVKDFGLYQDPKITNAKWLEENKDNLPQVVMASNKEVSGEGSNNLDKFSSASESESKEKDYDNDIPFSSPGSLTNEDKLAVIEKLAKDKLGATPQETMDKVMEKTGIAFIPANYDRITEALVIM